MKGSKIKVALIGLLPALLGAAAGLAAASLVITAQDSGKTFTVQVGQRLTVNLSLTGDSQVVAPEFNPEVLTILGQSLESSFGPQGSAVRVSYELVVLKEGQTDLVIGVKSPKDKSGRGKPYLKVKIVAGRGMGV